MGGSQINNSSSVRLTKSDYSNMAWRMKFQHAEELRHHLSAQLSEVEQAFPPSIEQVSWDGNTLKYLLTSHAPMKLEWSLTLGDCLHNYRSALDALYFSIIQCLADRHGRELSEYMETSIQFPIWTEEKKFEGTKGLKEYGTSVLYDDLLVHQPFKNLEDFNLIESHPLEQLRLLSNKDRHRQLNPVQTILSDYSLFHMAGIEVVNGRRISNSAKPNEHLFEFDVRYGKATDNIQFIPRFTTGVSPVQGSLPHNSVENLLGLIGGQVFDYIEKLEYHLEHDLGELLT